MNRTLGKSIIIFAGALLLSCKKDESPNPEFHFNYYPLETGRFVVYDAMEIHHDVQALIQHDTTRFLLKTVIGEQIVDLEGDVAFKFYRYWKINPEDEWVIKDVWTTKRKDLRIELVEENKRMVKLVFAPTLEKVWDINAFNNDATLNARYDAASLHGNRTINNIYLDSTLRVNQQDFFSLVDHRKKYEIYAPGIGLVYKFYKNNNILNFDTLNIRNGNEIHYSIVDFGQE
jgi:hypothetical protein